VEAARKKAEFEKREQDRVERERLLKERTKKEEEEAARKKAELEKRERESLEHKRLMKKQTRIEEDEARRVEKECLAAEEVVAAKRAEAARIVQERERVKHERLLGEHQREVRRAIDCFQNTFKFATVSFELGSLLSQIEEHIDSAHCFNVALEIRKALLGDSFVVARTNYSLGVTIASQELKEN
jgi:hypothetical protein